MPSRTSAAESAPLSGGRGQPFVLLPHPALPAPDFSIDGELAFAGGELTIRYAVRGDLARLRLPPPSAPTAADGLWQHLCLELFVADGEGGGYREFNFSPSSQWASYAFTDYRVRDQGAAAVPAPAIDCRRLPGALELRARLSLVGRGPGEGRPCRFAVAAVLEECDGRLSWWALHHPAGRPDFHHRDAFVLSLTERP